MNYTSSILVAEIWLQPLHIYCMCVCVLCPVCVGIKAIERSDIFAAAVKQTAKPSRLQEMSKR